MSKPKSALDRLLKRTYYDHGCWTVTGPVNAGGYPTVNVNIGFKKNRRSNAHRAVYIELNGDVSNGWHIDHLCRNKRCINPLHLEAVTHAENLRRGDHWWSQGLTSPRLRSEKSKH